MPIPDIARVDHIHELAKGKRLARWQLAPLLRSVRVQIQAGPIVDHAQGWRKPAPFILLDR